MYKQFIYMNTADNFYEQLDIAFDYLKNTYGNSEILQECRYTILHMYEKEYQCVNDALNTLHKPKPIYVDDNGYVHCVKNQ